MFQYNILFYVFFFFKYQFTNPRALQAPSESWKTFQLEMDILKLLFFNDVSLLFTFPSYSPTSGFN